MSDEHDNSDGGDEGGFWSQFPIWMKIVAGLLTGAAALFAAVPPLLNAIRHPTPPVNATPMPQPQSPAKSPFIVIPTQDHFLALRDRPNATSNLIIKMQQGSHVQCSGVLEDRPEWRICTFSGYTGYANARYLNAIAS